MRASAKKDIYARSFQTDGHASKIASALCIGVTFH